jgi:hypothetical protein
MVRRYGGAEPSTYLMSSHMPTRVTVRSPNNNNTWGGKHGSASVW